MIRLAILLAIVVSLTGCDGGYRQQQQLECQNASYGKTVDHESYEWNSDHEHLLRVHLFAHVSSTRVHSRYIKCLEINN